MRDGTFSFSNFYKRRIQRILPLTFVVTAGAVFFGYFILLQPDFEGLVESAFATSTFWANIFFWRDGGYFGGEDKLKPLLHMWSLSVEEQFYIVFPAIFWILIVWRRMSSIKLLSTVGFLIVLSFLAYIGLRQAGGWSPAFFLMPTRAWQFGFGALAALFVANSLQRNSIFASTAALIVLMSCFFFTIPLVPSSLLITFAASIYFISTYGSFFADRLLSTSIMTYLGLRSFSIYLWHWPIAAFLGYAFVEGIPFEWKLLGVALTFLLSEASFRFVESPFRYKMSLSASLGLIATCSVSMISMAVISNLRSAKGLPELLASQIQSNFRCEISEFVPYGSSRACILRENAPSGNIAILGNSHAQMYAPAVLDRYAQSSVGITLVPLNGCTPTPNLNISLGCAIMAQSNLDALLADESISTVFIGTTYEHAFLVTSDGTRLEEPQFGVALLDLVKTLESREKQVYVIGPILTPGFNLASEMARRLRFGSITEDEAHIAFLEPRSAFEETFGETIGTLSDQLGSAFLQPHLELCNDDVCHFADERGSFFSDSNHLGHYGVETISPIFDAVDTP